jgi:hypothetical protein
MNDVSAGTHAGKSKWGPVGKVSLWLAAIALGLLLLVILGILSLRTFGSYESAICWLIVYSLPVLVWSSFKCGLSAAIIGFVVWVSPSQKGARAFGSAFLGFSFGLLYVIVVSFLVVSFIIVFWPVLAGPLPSVVRY